MTQNLNFVWLIKYISINDFTIKSDKCNKNKTDEVFKVVFFSGVSRHGCGGLYTLYAALATAGGGGEVVF